MFAPIVLQSKPTPIKTKEKPPVGCLPTDASKASFPVTLQLLLGQTTQPIAPAEGRHRQGT
jgi:hypothetical protein